MIVILLFAGCGRKIESEITVQEVLDRNTEINWFGRWEETANCSIIKYLEEMKIENMDNNEYEFGYVYYDMDGDENRDIIIQSTNYYEAVFVVIKKKGKYYGLALSAKEAEEIYSSRIIWGCGGCSDAYYRIETDENGVVVEKLLASADYFGSEYTLYGASVDEQEYTLWVEENCREPIFAVYWDESRKQTYRTH